ncbi:MAG: sporulation protein [Peptococcaceae bacterium]|nr:sporulation protein [Peptococcaceae bacterium]
MFKKLQKQAGEILDFPSDVLGAGPKITMIGRSTMTIELFQEVILFSEEEIILGSSEGKIRICGKDFVLTTVLPTEVHLKGWIRQVSFEED